MNKFLSTVITLVIALYPTLVSGQASVQIADESTIVGQSLLYPVTLLIDDGDVTGINFKISYDTLAFDYIGTSELSTISDSVLSIGNGVDGLVQFSLASTHSIKSSGTIVNLEFVSKLTGDTQFSIKEFRINEEDPVFEAGEARIRVFGEGGNQPPYAVNIPDTLQLFSNDTLYFNVDESVLADAEDPFDSLDIQISVDPQVVSGSYDETSGLITIITADFIGYVSLNIRVKDTNGGVFEESIVLEILVKVSNEMDGKETAQHFHLNQNYPNPFNPTTLLSFTLNKTGLTKLEVYNIHGQKIATLLKARLSAGHHSITFDASSLSSGVYLYRLSSGSQIITKKMMLIK